MNRVLGIVCIAIVVGTYVSKAEVKPDVRQAIEKELKSSKHFIGVQNDSALNKALAALNLSYKHHYTDGINRANLLLASIHSELQDWATPIEKTMLTNQVLRQLSGSNPLSKVLYDVAEDYYKYAQRESAARTYKFSADIAEKEGNLGLEVEALIRLSDVYLDFGWIVRAQEVSQQACRVAVAGKQALQHSDALRAVARAQQAAGRYGDAQKSYLAALDVAPVSAAESRVLCAAGLVRCSMLLNRPAEAKRYIDYCRMVAGRSRDLQVRVPYQQVLAEYLEKSDPRQALQVYKQYMTNRDSLILKREIAYITKIRIDINSHRNEQNIESIRQQVNIERIKRRTFIVVSLIMTVLVVLIISTVRRRNKMLRRENDNANDRIRLNQEHLENLEERALLQKQKEENRKEQERLEKNRLLQELEKVELEQRKLELELDEKHRSLLSSSIQTEQYNDFLSSLMSELNALKTCNDKRRWGAMIDKLSGSIRGYINHVDEWENVMLTFEKVHPSFFDRLRGDYPTLTLTELKFCAYTKMNMDSKEISRLLNIAPTSVLVSRHRLKRKMNLSEDISFTDYIINTY